MLSASLILWMAYVASGYASPPVRYVSHKNCNGLPAGTYISHPSNCHQFVRCHGLRSVLGDCPAGTFFNPAVYSCDRTRQSCEEYKLEKLKLSEQKQMDALAEGEASEASSQATQEGHAVKEAAKESEKDVVRDTVKDTAKVPEVESVSKVPSLLSVTTGRPALRPLFGVADPSSSSSAGRPVCTYWKDAQFAHPSNCEYYYKCQRGYLTIRRCYRGFGWDTRRQRCVPRREAVCQRR